MLPSLNLVGDLGNRNILRLGAAKTMMRGRIDDAGKELHATVLAVADEVAAAAGLVMGKTRRTPVVVVRGLELGGKGSGRELIRPAAEDLFR